MRWHPFTPDPGFGSPWWGLAHLVVGGLGTLFWLALIGLAIWAIVRWTRRRPTQGTPTLSATEVLRQRFARGEIDATTFSQMMERLSASEAPNWGQTGYTRPYPPAPTDYSGGTPTPGAEPV